MSNARYTRYSTVPSQTVGLTKRDFRTLARLQADCYDHSSGGSFDMLACHVKGSRFATGKNELKRSGSTMDSSFVNPLVGVHAELCLYANNSIRGGTVFIVGVRSKSGTPLSTTRPCNYCAAILDAAKVRFVVYMQDGIATKCSPTFLLTVETKDGRVAT